MRVSADERYIRVLQTVIDLATDNVFVNDCEGVFLFVGSACAAAFELDQEAAIGLTPSQAGMAPAIAQRLEADWHRVFAYGEPSCAELRIETDTRTGPRDFEYVVSPVRDERGVVEGVITTLHDVEERRRIEQNLRDSEARFRTLAEMLPQLVWIASPSGALEYANRRWCDFTGLALTRILRGAWYTAVPEHDSGVMRVAWEMAERTMQPFEVELRLKSASGRYHWFLIRGEPMKDESGEVVHWFGTCTDIDAQKRQFHEQRFFGELTDRMRTTLDPELVLWEAVSAIGQHLAVSRCNYSEFDNERDVVVIHRDYCRGVASHVGSYPLGSFGGIIDELQRGRTVVCSNTTTDPRTAHLLKDGYDPLAVRAFVAVPLLQDGVTTGGILSVHQSEPREWEADEIELLETAAERTWLAWKNAILTRETVDAAERQRAFMRDILASVTEGKLILCHRPEDLPRPMSETTPDIDISAPDGMAGIRNLARNCAQDLNFDMARTYDLITAVGEASMNAVVHAGGGIARICTNGVDRMQVWIIDQGRGIDVAVLPQSTLKFGYTTAGSLGHGMKMILQTADCLYLMTNPHGTTVVIEHGRFAPDSDILK